MPPPKKFPSVTGIKFMKVLRNEKSPPLMLPKGSKNIFATLCSNPETTKSETGKMQARIFPETFFAAPAI